MKKQVLLAVFLGASVAVFAQTNMTLEGTQTNTGNKTFLNGTLLFRNVAGNVSSSFTNTNDAPRTYTLPNLSGTVLVSGSGNSLLNGSGTTASGLGINLGGTLTTSATFSGAQSFVFSNWLNQSLAINPTVSMGTAGQSAFLLAPTIATSATSANKSSTFLFGNSVTFSAANAYHAIVNFGQTLNNGGFNNGTFTGYYYNPTITGAGTGTKHYAAVFGSGNVGIGTLDPTSALHVAGAFTLADGTQGVGKVLTSNANGLATWQTPASGSTSDFGTAAELGYYSSLRGTVSGVTQVPHLAFRGDATRAITDGVTDVYLGPNNGNTASAAGGNIGIGSYNLNQINAAGTWTGTPFFSYFRGDRNIAIGFQNGMSLTGGAGNAATTNILIGNNVLKASTQQSYNIFIGFQSAMNMSIPLNGFDGQSNVALGQYNMQNVTGGTASFNTAIGPSVLRQTTSISSANTFVGSGAGLNATIVGSNNTVVGDDGFRNVSWTTSGNSFNTGLGSGVFRQAVEGLTNSTAVGTSSMRWGGGSDNSALGRSSGWTLRGTGNTAIGFQSAHVADNSYTTTAGTPYTGSNSTFIGYRAGYKAVDAAISNVIVIGNDFQPSLQPGNVYLGSGNELIAFTGGTEKLRISSSGAIIKDGDLTIDNNSNGGNPSVYLGSGTEELNRYLQVANSQGLSNSAGLKAGGVLVADSYSYANPAKNDLVVKGKVGIGTPLLTNPNNYMLAVNGKIGAKDVQIETSSTTWPDYVFSPSYQLPSLQAVEKFIQENKHLENVPSAEEIAQNGHSLGEMDKILLKKVEELTLYIIQQQKEIEALKKLLEKK